MLLSFVSLMIPLAVPYTCTLLQGQCLPLMTPNLPTYTYCAESHIMYVYACFAFYVYRLLLMLCVVLYTYHYNYTADLPTFPEFPGLSRKNDAYPLPRVLIQNSRARAEFASSSSRLSESCSNQLQNVASLCNFVISSFCFLKNQFFCSNTSDILLFDQKNLVLWLAGML